MEYEIKGPFSYSGNKFKIYKKHLANIVINYDRVVEMFAGSSPLLYNSKKGGCGIDIEPSVIFLHKSLLDDKLHEKILDIYSHYFPNGKNSDGYYKLRDEFNKIFLENGFIESIAPHLHLLVQLSFNSLLRFSSNGYNVPFGRKNLDVERIKKHSQIFREKKLQFFNLDYQDLDLNIFDKRNTLVYLDPPYVASKYHYGGWKIEDEQKLLNYIDKIAEDGWDFILSNTLCHRGVENKLLQKWSKKYNIKTIDKKYNMWSASVKNVKIEKDTIEVLISNIKI